VQKVVAWFVVASCWVGCVFGFTHGLPIAIYEVATATKEDWLRGLDLRLILMLVPIGVVSWLGGEVVHWAFKTCFQKQP
jgi:hypothetical protein